MDDDDDIDIVIAPETSPDHVRKALESIGATIVAQISLGKKITNENYWIGDVYFDIYYLDEYAGSIVDYSRYGGCVFLLEHLRTGTKQLIHDDARIIVPEDSEQYLEYLYGPGWREPDPDWRWYQQQSVVEIRGSPLRLLQCYMLRRRKN